MNTDPIIFELTSDSILKRCDTHFVHLFHSAIDSLLLFNGYDSDELSAEIVAAL